ncbi:MAG: hypothetical protein NTV24_05010 [Candidatus Woesebacteria bacterium]|nr:hypothetical protein [Candidatus Woesebacteria bacterium]
MPKLKLVKFDEEKHLPKTVEEKLNDDFFILLTAYIGETNGLAVNRLNLQKTIFLTKLVLYEKGIKFFNTSFYKYLYGPYQKRVFFSTQRLAGYSLIEKEDKTGNDIVLTNEGINFLIFTLGKLSEDPNFKEYRDITKSFLQEFSGKNARKSIDITHSMKVQIDGETKTVNDLADTEDLYLEPVERVNYKSEIVAPEDAIINLVNYREYALHP